MKKKIIPVIICGGTGSRLWPRSRSDQPKPFIPLISNQSLFDLSLERINVDSLFENPIIIGNHEHLPDIKQSLLSKQMEAAHIVLEPCAKNTASAIAIAALLSPKERLILVLPADHMIKNTALFLNNIELGSKAALLNFIVTFGIVPNRPETGYGYIRKGATIPQTNCSNVDVFVEKPNLKNAKKYFEEKTYLWNSGMFLSLSSHIIEELENYHPEIIKHTKHALEKSIRKDTLIFPELEHYKKLPNIPIDIAVMEKTQTACVYEAEFDWDDLGDWNAIWRYKLQQKKDIEANQNIYEGNILSIDSSKNYAYAQTSKIVLAGVENLAVIETGDSVLVADKTKLDKLKDVTQALSDSKDTRLKTPTKFHKPWGSFESLAKLDECQLKSIMVEPGEKLSLQKHKHRKEHWIVLQGKATITVEHTTKTYSKHEHVFIPKNTPHRLENLEDEQLEILEIQLGSYLGEDDIQRLDDIYNRTELNLNPA